MASRNAISNMLGTFSAVWATFRKSSELSEIYLKALNDIPDDLLEEAIRKVVLTCKHPPVPSDVVEAAEKARRETLERDRREFAREQERQYPTYWERSPAERAEIDAARNECMRVVRSLSGGDGGTWGDIARESIRR